VPERVIIVSLLFGLRQSWLATSRKPVLHASAVTHYLKLLQADTFFLVRHVTPLLDRPETLAYTTTAVRLRTRLAERAKALRDGHIVQNSDGVVRVQRCTAPKSQVGAHTVPSAS
jgi:hypothetical protein